MNASVRAAIEEGDAPALRALLASDAQLAEVEVTWDDNQVNQAPPLHFVCDARFRGLVSDDVALELANALLSAGADPTRAYAKSGDTFLIAAASLGAESVGLRLVELGVDVQATGLFGATALHWSAFMGLDALARALLEAGSQLELVDTQYDCTPLQWALYAWTNGTNGRREGVPRAARVLVEADARLPDGVADKLSQPTDVEMRAALGLS